MGSTEATMILLLLCLVPSLSFSQDVKPGHDHVKEHHMHVYWFQNNEQQEHGQRQGQEQGHDQEQLQRKERGQEKAEGPGQGKGQTEEALRLRDLLVGEVAAKQLLVVLNGVTSYIWPGLDDSKVPNFNMEPIGPHPCGSYEVWVPQEGMSKALSFLMYHRGNLSVLVHPLGKTELMDHTRDAMWLGPSFPIDTSILDTTGGDEPQYPELGLGYSAV